MPKSWSDHDEHQYKSILSSLGNNPRAKEIAARTVNKHRSMEGRTKEQAQARVRERLHAMVQGHMRKG